MNLKDSENTRQAHLPDPEIMLLAEFLARRKFKKSCGRARYVSLSLFRFFSQWCNLLAVPNNAASPAIILSRLDVSITNPLRQRTFSNVLRNDTAPVNNLRKTTMKKLILVFMIVLASASLAAADTIYLRGGTSIRGNVLGFINGRFAIQLTANGTIPVRGNRNQSTNTTETMRNVRAGEVIFLRPGAIERIEIDGRSLDDARYQTRTVDVSLGSNWVDSGIDLRRGERVRLTPPERSTRAAHA